MLIGRSAETAELDRVLAGAREGRSGVLVIRGEAGIGKSALLDYTLEHAAGMTVLSGIGIETESELPFAALHQIFRPVLDRIERLPEPQETALRAAFGLSAETEDDRFRIAVGVLGLLAEAAEERPVLCVVDDAQWLDDASADALLFAARRLEAEPIALILAARDGSGRTFAASALPSLVLSALSLTDARSLVVERLGQEPAPEVLDWLLESANGNPLALVELPESLTVDQRAGRAPLRRGLLQPTSVEQEYLDRVARLPPATRELLVVAAAEETGDRATITRAAAELGLEEAELAAAEHAGLLRVGTERIEFRHPLVRSAVYHGAGFAERERAHRVLAAVLAADADADRRAWHRAAASVGADDEIAAELEATAGRAQLRGGSGVAAAALERAADLSADPGERGRRLVLAATAANQAGRMARAITLADRAEPLVGDPVLRADLALARGGAELLIGRPDLASDILAAAAEAVAERDPPRAFQLTAVASESAAMSGDPERWQRATAAGMLIEPDPEDARQVLFATMLRGGAYAVSGDTAAAAPLLEEVIARLGDAREAWDTVRAAVAAVFLGDWDRARRLYSRATAQARMESRLGLLAHTLAAQADTSFFARKLSDAAAQADEAVRLARDLGAENPALRGRALLAWIAALQGREDDCRREAQQVLELAGARGLALPAGTATWALAELDLGRGRWAEALAHLEALAEVRPGFGHPLFVLFSTADRVEAAVRAGATESARGTLEGFERWTESSGAAWAQPLVARCRGLVASGVDEAAEHFEEALRLHRAGGSSYDRARTDLVYGELLRRERRRIEARGHLRTALNTFEQLGAAFWSERAADELRATGETTRKRDASTIAQLTPQELQIARLVAEGAANKEVAAQLFLSPRTVEYHLRKVFAKLGISSRAELIRLSRDVERESPALQVS